MSSTVYESPLGRIRLTSADGVTISSLEFVPDAEPEGGALPVLDQAAEWLDRYFSGIDPGPVPPLAPAGTEFQRRVWRELCRVGFGQTVTYGELARRVGCRSARAVGSALGCNPILLMIPCHRVLAATSLGGFSAGIPLKRALLSLENKIL